MSLKSQVIAVLQRGSVNVPGKDAISVLAERVKCASKSELKNVLTELMAEGNLDLGGGNVHHTSFVGLRRDYRPRTENGRRESKYAVDQVGNHYRGTAVGGPVTTRQATLEEWVRMGNDPSTYKFGTPANEIQPQEATPIMDADVPKPESTVTDEAPANAVEPVTNEQPKTKKKLAPRVNTAPQRERNENVEKLKQLIVEESARTAEGLIPSGLFKALAAERLNVGEKTISKYLSELVDIKFIEFVKTKVWQGEMNIRLAIKLSTEEKLNAVLELLRVLKKKKQRRALTDEVAELLGTTPKSAQVSYLSMLHAVGAYKTERDTTEKAFKFKLTFVQDGPLTSEQMETIRELRRKPEKANSSVPTAQTETIAGLEQLDPAPVVFTDDSEDEIASLVSGLVDTNDRLAAEVDRLASVNASLEQQLVEALERRDFYHVLAEAERLRPTVVTPQKPVLPEDLLARARAAIATTKELSSADS